MRLASGADLPTGMINIDDLPTVAEQLGQLPLLDSNVIDVRLDNSQYDLGDAVKITVTSNTYPEFDMVIASGLGNEVYHYDENQYPVTYYYVLSGTTGKYSVRVTAKHNDALYEAHANFNVVSSHLKPSDIFEEQRIVQAQDIRNVVANSLENVDIVVADHVTGQELESFSVGRDLELKMTMHEPDGSPGSEIGIAGIRNARWENADRIRLKDVNTDIIDDLEKEKIIVQKGVTVEGIDDLVVNDYTGFVKMNVAGVPFNVVMHCDDSSDFINNNGISNRCSRVEKCSELAQNFDMQNLPASQIVQQACFDLQEEILYVFVPHFSSVLIALDAALSNMTIYAPDNSSALPSGKDVSLNFSINEIA